MVVAVETNMALQFTYTKEKNNGKERQNKKTLNNFPVSFTFRCINMNYVPESCGKSGDIVIDEDLTSDDSLLLSSPCDP